jgi:Large polyvalent protein-associated domain 3
MLMSNCEAIGRHQRNFSIKIFNARKLKTVPIVEQLIRDGVQFKPSEKPYNAADTTTHVYHYLRTQFELEGETLAARIVIREDKEGHFHYDHTVEDASIVFDLPKTKGLPK